ncbi:dihydrodipicolinate synthase family protein [Paenibacillus sanfengchensis]
MTEIRQKVLRVKERLYGGLIPAVPVPRYRNGKIHAEAQRSYAAYLCAQNIAGVSVWVHTGRGLHLSREERALVIGTWKECLGPDQLLIAGAGARPDPALNGADRVEAWRRDSLFMAEEARRAGADALLVFPPAILNGLEERERNDAIVEYHRELAEAGLPLILFYLYEEAGGVKYPAALLRELLTFPQVAGIKMAALDSVMTLQEVAFLLRNEFPDKLLITGEDRMFGYSLMCGATAALVGLGAAYPNIQSDLISAYLTRDYARFMDLSARVDGYARTVFTPPMDKYILRLLTCLGAGGMLPSEAFYDIAGFDMREDEAERLRSAIHEYGVY